MKPDYWDRAKRALARKDPVMAAIIRSRPKVFLARRGEPFVTLSRAIVGQQISVKAAQSVWDKVCLCAGAVTPQSVLARRRSELRACGLSERKVEYIADLAQHSHHGQAGQRLATLALGGDLVPVALARSVAGRILTARRSARIARR